MPIVPKTMPIPRPAFIHAQNIRRRPMRSSRGTRSNNARVQTMPSAGKTQA